MACAARGPPGVALRIPDAPSSFPRAQPQRVLCLNFSLSNFKFSLVNVLRRALI
jgi:hypothetical protein